MFCNSLNVSGSNSSLNANADTSLIGVSSCNCVVDETVLGEAEYCLLCMLLSFVLDIGNLSNSDLGFKSMFNKPRFSSSSLGVVIELGVDFGCLVFSFNGKNGENFDCLFLSLDDE